jgi:T5SS/PEP-CTERM-associated repeat protein
MKNSVRHLLLGVVGALFGVIAVEDVKAQANSWTNTVATGLWQDPTKWSLLAAPTSTHTAVFITNATTKTVTINSATLPGNLTISNLTVRGFGAGINTLQLTNAPASTLLIRNALTIGTNAVLTVTNSALRVDGLAGSSFSFIVDGSVTNLAGGQIIATNLTIGATATGRGNLTTLGELLQVSNSVVVGAVAGAQGTLTVAGGSNVFNFSLTVGENASSTGAVWVTGGQLIVTNSTTTTIVGSAGIGQMTVSNGTWRAGGVRIGNAAGTRGVLTLAGGTNTLTSLTVGFNANATGTVWMTGGQLVVTNASGSIQVGRSGVGQMTVSNGSCQAATVNVGPLAGSQGTLTVAGGTNSIYSGLTVGAITCDATGTVVVTGGQLFVTNAAGNALLNIGGGTVTLTGGLLQADKLVMTTTCAHVIFNGGMLTTKSTVVTNGDYFYVGSFGNSATLTLLGGTHSFGNGLALSGSTGTVWMSATQLVVTNETFIGGLGVGEMTVSNGTWLGQEVRVGNVAGPGGTLTLAGGTNEFSGQLIAAYFPNSTGAIWKTDGMLVTTNQATRIGLQGRGQMTVSNGLWLGGSTQVGVAAGGCGTLTFAGGTNRFGGMDAGSAANSTGQIWQTGGLLIVTNSNMSVGSSGIGQMTVSNGTWLAGTVFVAGNAGSKGTLNVEGGTNSARRMFIGSDSCASTGIVTVTGGSLIITNVGFGVIEIRSGTFTMSGGFVQADEIILTNSCANFARTGGTLIYSNALLIASRDDDGDGISNGYEQDHGLDPLNPADANLDSDGDGLTNLQEFIAGTDADDSASALRITGIAAEGNDIRVTWQTGPGKTNALERTAGAAGSYSNNFAAIFTVTNTVGTTTNYLHVGAATNVPAFYYRVRLVQ